MSKSETNPTETIEAPRPSSIRKNALMVLAALAAICCLQITNPNRQAPSEEKAAHQEIVENTDKKA